MPSTFFKRLPVLSIALAISFCLPLFAQEPAARSGMPTGRVTMDSVTSLTSSWPEKPRDMAKKLMEKYGPPNEATESELIWHKNGPWKRTILFKKEIPHEFPSPHTDFLQQVIDYRVPPEKFDDLAKFDGSVIVERTKGELSARCDMEELNMLALNLAHDVITGKRNVEDARSYYAKTAMAFKQGKTESYTASLQFQVPQGGTEDPDKPAAPAMASSSMK